MSPKAPRNIGTLLNDPSGHLSTITRHVRHLQRLNEALYAILPVRLKSHVVVANFTGGILVLCADSPAWATQLHYHLALVMEALRKQLPGLQDIRVRNARPMPATAEKNKPRQMQLTRKSSNCLSICADHVNDQKLRNALRRLARYGR